MSTRETTPDWMMNPTRLQRWAAAAFVVGVAVPTALMFVAIKGAYDAAMPTPKERRRRARIERRRLRREAKAREAACPRMGRAA